MFRSYPLKHGDRAPWQKISHIRVLPDARADSPAGKRALDHIRRLTNSQGIAAISTIAPRFPARKKSLPPVQGMRDVLRHMANEQDAGISKQDKGLLELGWNE